jgi:hypothetical protein
MTAAVEPRQLPTFSFNSDAQARTALDRGHKFVINFGGKGSGKTALHPLWAYERGTFDTSGLHGIFTNTEKQLKDGVLLEMAKRLPYWGVEIDFGRRPPRAWSQRWARRNIRIPQLTDYRGIFYTSEGLHALCGTLFNQSYKQYETLEFLSLRLEEVPAISQIALTTMLTRLRCGEGENCEVTHGHRHQAHIFGNPPVGAHPWLFDWLDTWEEGAKQQYHPLSDGETCDGCFLVQEDGTRIAKTHGPHLQHRQWPLLRQGIGSAILVKSKTSDNRKNLNRGFENDLARNFDRATAQAWLHGELVREVAGGCYAEFSDANVRNVEYDPNRTLYVCIDINTDPRVAVLAHPLIPGEYPTEWDRPGVEQIGVFGEFFDVGGMSDRHFAEAMMSGNRGGGEAGYQDLELRGLPASWHGLLAHKGPVMFYGDADGNRRSVHDEALRSSWAIMQETFRRLPKWGIDVPANNPPARSRIHSVNGKLRSSDTDERRGAPSLSIAPRAKHTKKDCETVVWDEKGLAEREWRQGPEKLRTHCMAAVGYMIWRRSPMGHEVDQTQPDFSTLNPSPIEPPRMR